MRSRYQNLNYERSPVSSVEALLQDRIDARCLQGNYHCNFYWIFYNLHLCLYVIILLGLKIFLLVNINSNLYTKNSQFFRRLDSIFFFSLDLLWLETKTVYKPNSFTKQNCFKCFSIKSR